MWWIWLGLHLGDQFTLVRLNSVKAHGLCKFSCPSAVLPSSPCIPVLSKIKTHGFMLKVAANLHATLLHNHNLFFFCPINFSLFFTRTHTVTYTLFTSCFFSSFSCHSSHWEQSNSLPHISKTAAHILCSTLGTFSHSYFQLCTNTNYYSNCIFFMIFL